MLADMLTMWEHSTRPLDEVAYCYLGDARFNTGNSLMVTGCKLGMDVRLCAPSSLWPDPELVATARSIAAGTAPAHAHRGRRRGGAWRGLPLYGRLGVHGRGEVGLDGPHPSLQPYQVNMDVIRSTENPAVRFMHCLPSFHDRETKIGEQIYEEFGLESVEVTDEVFESPHSIVFDQAENRLHTIKAVMVPRWATGDGDQSAHPSIWRREADDRRCPGGQRAAASFGADDRRRAAEECQCGGAGDRAADGRAPGRGGARQRTAGRPPRPPGRVVTTPSSRIPSTCSAPRRRG